MAVFNHFKSVISQKLHHLKWDKKRHQKASEITSSQTFEISCTIYSSIRAVFTASVNFQSSSRIYHVHLEVKDNNVIFDCDCKD